MNPSEECPPSLAQLFEPPTGSRGIFGWLCGFSADRHFLDKAVERFTQLTEAQRAHEGSISLVLFLDRSQPQIPLHFVPGVLHAPMQASPPFRLLHAKVAILGFQDETDHDDWTVRLIVSTGNWTTQTLLDSLDLAWVLELSRADLIEGSDSTLQERSDLVAAWDLLQWLVPLFDLRLLEEPSLARLITPRKNRLTDWCESLRIPAPRLPRVFDNRSKSFLAQLPTLIQTHAKSSARNYLALGSGFFESCSTAGAVPEVLSAIVETLREAGLLTLSPECDVLVNPQACQGVALTSGALRSAGWNIKPAVPPEFLEPHRSLHGKFLFSATEHARSNLCRSPWAYLGSGNLTHPGFLRASGVDSGNLEAGVVFRPDGLCWSPERGLPRMSRVQSRFPLNWDVPDELPLDLAAGDEAELPTEQFVACPISGFCAESGPTMTLLHAFPEKTSSEWVAVNVSGAELSRAGDLVEWTGPLPRSVRVRWEVHGRSFEAELPVIDEYGRAAATPLTPIDLDLAWAFLANFPGAPDEDEFMVDQDVDGLMSQSARNHHEKYRATTPIRQMMQLLEDIADKQTRLLHSDWNLWCHRLQQTLSQAADSPVIQEFKTLGLNPLGPLRARPFRPSYACDRTTIEGQIYDTVIDTIEQAWGVSTLEPLGGPT